MRQETDRRIAAVPDHAEVSKILVIAAHPDDVDFGLAGTVATWTDAGIEVVYCIVTNGDAGGRDLGYPDGRLEPSLGLRRDISRVIRQVRPDRVACQSPERNYARIPASHPDHRAAGSAALDAVYPDARNPFAFPELADEGLEPWIVPEVWISSSPQVTHFVDVTDTFDRKIAALRAHESQTSHMDNLADMLRGWLSRSAAMGGLPEGRLAEGFQVLEIP